MSGDHLERLDTFANHWQAAMDDDLVSEVIAVIDGKPLRKSDLRAALNELGRLRAQRTALDGQVFVAGWYAHAEACASLGRDAREAAWRKHREEMAETLADAEPQRPERGVDQCELECSEGHTYVWGECAAAVEPKRDPDGDGAQ